MSLGRRRYLIGSVGAFTGLAGCSSLFRNSSNTQASGNLPPLFRVEIDNTDEEPHDVHLLVQRDGEIVHWAKHEIPAGVSQQEQSNTRGIVVVIESSAWPSCPGRFVINATFDEREEWAQLDFSEENFTNYQAKHFHIVEVRLSEDPGISINAYRLDRTHDCKTTTETTTD